MTLQSSMKSSRLYCVSLVARIRQLRPRSKLHWGAILLATAVGIGVLAVLSLEQKSSAIWKRRLPLGLHQRWADAAIDRSGSCQCPTVQSAAETEAPQTKPHQAALPTVEYYVMALNSMSPRRNDSFDPQINATELGTMLDLLWTFLDLCEHRQIEVMLYGGTLLGSYRHHGVMPWDDDIDLLMKESDQEKLETVIKENFPDLTLTQAGRWKVWNKSACVYRNPRYSWCWPYLDLSFYRLAGGLLFDTVTAYGWNYSYPVELTFPLHRRPFMGRWVNSPRDALRFLGHDKTPTDQCISLYYSHKLEDSPVNPEMTASCASLTSTYPFVVRVPDPRVSNGVGLLEVLRFHGGLPVYSMPVDEPATAFNVEYSILLPTEP